MIWAKKKVKKGVLDYDIVSMLALLPMIYTMKIIKNIFGIKAAFIVLILITSVPVISLTGCGGKAILSEQAVKTRNIHDYVYKLKELYEQKDNQITSTFSREYLTKDVTAAIRQDFEKFDNISLKFFMDKIHFNRGQVNVTVHWNGVWKDKDKTFLEGGSMLLQLQYEDTIIITGIKGDSPFGISQRLLEKQ